MNRGALSVALIALIVIGLIAPATPALAESVHALLRRIKATVDLIEARIGVFPTPNYASLAVFVEDVRTRLIDIHGYITSTVHGIPKVLAEIANIKAGDSVASKSAANVTIAAGTAHVVIPIGDKAFWGMITVESDATGYRIEVWDGDSWIIVVDAPAPLVLRAEVSGFGLRIWATAAVEVDYVFVYHIES